MLKRLLAAAGILWIVPSLAFAQTAQWQIGTAPSVSSGRYGTDTRTDVLYTAFTLRRIFDAGDVTVVAPVTCIRGDAGVTIVGGTPVRTNDPSVSPSTPNERGAENTRNTRPAATSTTVPASPVAPAATSECGPGDVILRGRVYLADERGWIPTVALRGHVKLPTASASRGLGTGRADEGIGVEVSRSLGPSRFLLADVGFTFIGDPADYALNNRWWYDLGVAQRFGSRLDVSLYFEEYSALVPGLPNARNVLGVVMVGGPTGWRVQVAADLGLSDGAPEHGLTVGLSRRF